MRYALLRHQGFSRIVALGCAVWLTQNLFANSRTLHKSPLLGAFGDSADRVVFAVSGLSLY